MNKFLKLVLEILNETETIEAPTKPKTTPKRHPFAPKPGQTPKPRPKALEDNASVKLFKKLRSK
jgi:hypothetical protein